MDEDKEFDIIPKEEDALPEVQNKSEAIANELMETEDPEKVKQLIDLFNIQTKKKNISRAVKVNEMLDTIVSTLQQRLISNPSDFQNFELVDYLTKLDDYATKITSKDADPNDNSLIRLTQNNQINIIGDNQLDTQSRKNVTAAVKQILQNIEQEAAEDIKEEQENAE